MLGELGESKEERKTPEQYFKNKLGKKSEDFLMLKRLVEETNGRISWEKLKEYTKIENGEVEGIYWEEDLFLFLTNITSLGKVRKVGGNLGLYNVSSLKDLGELEEVGGYLYLRGTSITSLGKLKKVGGDLDLRGTSITSLGKVRKVGGDLGLYNVSSLKDLGELEEVGGNVDLIGTSITSLGKLKKVGGDLNLYNVSSLKLQLEVMRKIKNGKLLVEGVISYDNYIKQYYTKDLKLDFEKFEEIYGKKVNKIEGDQQGQIREFLEGIKDGEKKYLEKEIVKILKENITEEEKKEKIAKLNDEYKVYIRRIDVYLL